MFILIILRDVSFLLSGKGNKVTESPATTIIHRVYESPYGIITTYETPAPRSGSRTHTLSPTHPIPVSHTPAGVGSRVRNHSTLGQVATKWSSGAFSFCSPLFAYKACGGAQTELLEGADAGSAAGEEERREVKEVAFDFLCSPAPKSMLRN